MTEEPPNLGRVAVLVDGIDGVLPARADHIAQFIEARWPNPRCPRCGRGSWFARPMRAWPCDIRLACQHCGHVETIDVSALDRFEGRSA